MANEIRLEVYTFGIRKKQHTGIFEPLDTFFEKNDFLEYFKKFINSNSNTNLEKGTKKTLQFFTDEGRLSVNIEERMISGVVKSGYWGTETEIVSGLIKNGEETTEEERKKKIKTHIKGEEDVELRPFYFMLYAPSGKSKGILILQREGVFGINGIFTRMLSTFFKTEYPDYKIDFSQFLSPILAKKLINDGGIKVLTLRRYELPKDVIDYLGITHGKETDSYTIELKLTANNDTLININNKAAKFASNPNNSFIEAPLMSKLGLTENTDTSITVLDGKHTRTIDLSDNMQLRPYYDIDTKVDKVKGHPVFASIDKLSKELITDVSSEMYPTEKAAKKSTA